MSPIRGRYSAQTTPVRQNTEPSARMHGRVRAHRYRLDVILCHVQDNRCVGMPPKTDGARSRKSDASLGVISAVPQRVELLGARRSQRKRPRSRSRSRPMVGDEGFAGRLAPPGSAPRPSGFESPSAPLNENGPVPGAVRDLWWAMRDSRGGSRRPVPLRALPGPRALRRRAAHAARLGSAPFRVRIPVRAPQRKRPRSRSRSRPMVGDEGFEPPALCV